MECENLTKVLPEVDFPFHEDTTKVKEMIAHFFKITHPIPSPLTFP